MARTSLLAVGLMVCATGCGQDGGSPRVDALPPDQASAQTPCARHQDVARAAARAVAAREQFPADLQRRLIAEAPIVCEASVLSDGSAGLRYRWLEVGKAGWLLETIVRESTGEVIESWGGRVPGG